MFSLTKLILFATAIDLLASAQDTISARPGLVNYFEGEVFVDGNPIFAQGSQPVFLNSGDELVAQHGRAEMLLMPGTYVRLGANSGLFMVSPSILAPRVELAQGEVILEVVGLLHGSHIEVVDNGAFIRIARDGLYRITADTMPAVGVIAGSVQVEQLGDTIKLTRGQQTGLAGQLKAEPLPSIDDDDLYAWSLERSQLEASAGETAGQKEEQTNAWYYSPDLNCWIWLPAAGVGYSTRTTTGGAAFHEARTTLYKTTGGEPGLYPSHSGKQPGNGAPPVHNGSSNSHPEPTATRSTSPSPVIAPAGASHAPAASSSGSNNAGNNSSGHK